MSVVDDNRITRSNAVPAVSAKNVTVTTTGPIVANVIAQGTVDGSIFARPSWGVVMISQKVGDIEHGRRTARAAGRRAVQKYGEALERLAD